MLHLADLLAEESFDLELMSGGPEAAEREVRGAHAVEVEAPARWLGPDWIMLTTGVRLRRNPEAQRALVPQLEAEGVSALGFGVGLGFKHVPPALVEVARERGFPVFAVPYETPFREIIHFVDSSLTSGEEQVFRRLTALQRYLVDALRTPQPEQAMVDRLAQLPRGQRGARRRRRPARDRRGQAAGRRAAAARSAASRRGWSSSRSTAGTPWRRRSSRGADLAARWLVLASPRRGFINKLAKPAAEATAPLLAAMARLSDVVRDQEQAVKAALLAEALEPVEARDLLPLAARAAAFGLDFSDPARLVVIARHPRRGEAGGARHRAASGASSSPSSSTPRIPHLAHQREESLTALVQGGDDEVRAALAAASDAFPDVVIGIGRAVTAIADAHHSLRDAELAADRGGLDPERRIMRFEDFDLGTFLVSEIAPERLEPKVDEILSVLRANAPLHEALSAYFAHDLDIAATAASLHMHRNSLRYRLARAEQVLGRSLKQPATIAAVYLALVAEAGDQSRAASLD